MGKNRWIAGFVLVLSIVLAACGSRPGSGSPASTPTAGESMPTHEMMSSPTAPAATPTGEMMMETATPGMMEHGTPGAMQTTLPAGESMPTHEAMQTPAHSGMMETATPVP